MSRVASGKLFVLIITNFVDMVGLLMIIPLMPFYALEMGGGGFEVAILMSAFTAAQLLSAPLWGRFSDRYGRRPALLVGLSAACVAYVVFAFATSIWLLLLSRIVQGAGGGTVGSFRHTSLTRSSPTIVRRRWAGCPQRRTSALLSDPRWEEWRSGLAGADPASRPRAFVS